ncbi:hypothetical protein DEIGR_100611 [Deinococcus grandis]|uniref:Peptidase M50 n=1 Tax=Deinococcus grandis TaxID=57498 RepID=A0A100HJL2_9DEIO|nr:hypothetical protein [Deinococcus grandis]BBN95934.1 hypothetical protein DEGR_26670 [Deinococcus grandis]GAQ20584.1 hypothetical protein DEIGR_100611 [Deinococcus grandis]
MSAVLIAAQVLAGLVTFVCLHELGHVLMARRYGDRSARFTLLGRRNGAWIVATTHTTLADTDSWPGVKVALAGPLFTRLLAEGLGLLLVLGLTPAVARPFVLTVFLLSRTDFWLYTLRDFAAGYLARRSLPGRDIADAVRGGAALVGRSQGQLFALLLGVSTLDLIVGWPRLAATLTGGSL